MSAFPDTPELNSTLGAIWDSCRQRWPTVQVDEGRYFAWLGSVAKQQVDALQTLRTTDLYLVCACLAGDRAALWEFDTKLLPRATGLIEGLGDRDFQAEALQLARQRLLLDSNPGGARLREYEGRGALITWLRTVVYREALMLRREGVPATPIEDEQTQLIDPAWSAELHYVRHVHRHEFARAFAETLATLDRTERSVLRLHTVEHLTIDRIAVIYGTHRATVSRWLSGARQKLNDGIERLLRERLKLSPDELEQLLTSLQENLGVSLGRLLDEGA